MVTAAWGHAVLATLPAFDRTCTPVWASVVAITTSKVPNGTVNAYYSAVITARGGCTPYKLQVGNRIRQATHRPYRQGVPQHEVLQAHRNTYQGGHRFFRRKSHRLRRTCLAREL